MLKRKGLPMGTVMYLAWSRPSTNSRSRYGKKGVSLKTEKSILGNCMYVCMYIWPSHIYSRVWINWVRLPILLVVSWTEELNIPHVPVMCLRIWSHETGSAVPSRVSLLIFQTQAKSGNCTDLLNFFRSRSF